MGTSLFGLITQIMIARYYGPAGNGIIAVSLLLPTTLAIFFNLGVTPANVYFIASSQVTLRKAWYTTVLLGGLMCILGSVVGVAVIKLWPQWFMGVPPLALWLALATFPSILFIGLISGFFQAKQNFKQYNRIGLLNPFLLFVLVILLISLQLRNPSFMVAATFIASSSTLVVSLIALQRQLSANDDFYPAPYARKVISYGSKTHLSNILAFLNYKADIFLVNIFLGPVSTGLYVVAVNISERLWILSKATSTIIFPRLSQLSSNPKLKDALTPLLARWILASTALVSLVVAVILPTVLPLLFGSRYQGSVAPMLCLLPGIVAGSASCIGQRHSC